MNDAYPVQFAVEYPDRDLNRVSVAFRIFAIIPIAIVLGTIGGYNQEWSGHAGDQGATFAVGGTGLLFLLRFTNRVGIYMALMDDRYPSTDEQQSVRLDFPYPDAQHGLNRWLPLVKWLLAIPHYIVLAFLYLGLLVVVIIAWFAILFTGRYPRGMFDYVEGVIRWHNRVVGYALILVTDAYPPFRLSP
jgi:hypothetical protein